MIAKFKLGIVYNEHGKIVNHRSLIKVIFNPFLRLVGFEIRTMFDSEKQKLCGVSFFKCDRKTTISFGYELANNWKIEYKRIFI